MRIIWMIIALSPLIKTNAQNGDIPFYKPGDLDLKTHQIKPHRIELKEISYQGEDEYLESYTYLTFDFAKQFEKEMYLIEWVAVTKYGTGLDINFVSKDYLDVVFRLTPKGLPWGHIIESHAFENEVNSIEVNADVELHLEEIKTVYPAARKFHQNPSKEVKYRSFNAIIWPYVLAAMDLKQGNQFVLPGFNSYTNSQFYCTFKVLGDTQFKDVNGITHGAIEVEAISKSTLAGAKSVKFNDEGNRTVFYISPEAPYFLGKEIVGFEEKKGRFVKQKWTLSSWQFLRVNAQLRIEEMVEEWKQIEKENNIRIPWQKE
ncbi:MAG: hypothetical protein ABJG47_16305 [Ekhidna sp.]